MHMQQLEASGGHWDVRSHAAGLEGNPGRNGVSRTASSFLSRASNSPNPAVQRVSTTKGGNSLNFGTIQSGQESLISKLRQHYRTNPSSGRMAKIFSRFLFQFQTITQVYMTLVYLVPHFFQEHDPMVTYCFKIFTCYLFVMGQANWLSSICYSSAVPDLKDRPDVDVIRERSMNLPERFGENCQIHIDSPTEERNRLSWGFCLTCQKQKPPRAHHCKFCRTCVLRRDHHCHLIGCCIGHYNQRYFVVLCCLGILTAFLGLVFTISYLTTLPGALWWPHYFLPWALVRFFTQENVTWQFLMLAFHVNVLIFFGSAAILYATSQMSLIVTGTTMYEVAKKVDIKLTTTKAENLRMVFGDYWLVNFLFPGQILFKQRHDGMHYEGIRILGKNKVLKE